MSPANLDPSSFELHNLLPTPSCVPLRYIVDPARLRFIGEGGVKSNWVRPGVHCDGNPENLSQPMPRARATLVARVAPRMWEVVEIDAHALPIDPELRERFIAWLADRYSVQVPVELRAAPAAAQEASEPLGTVSEETLPTSEAGSSVLTADALPVAPADDSTASEGESAAPEATDSRATDTLPPEPMPATAASTAANKDAGRKANRRGASSPP